MHILSISNTPHDPSQGSGYVITGYVKGLQGKGHHVDAHGPEDWRWIDVRRARRYVYPVLIALFGFWYCRPQEYDLIELWGGATWLLAIYLQWSHSDIPLVHHSNGIEQHRVEVQRKAPGDPIQNRRWFQWDMSPLHDLGLQASDAIVTVSSYDLPFLKERQFVPVHRLFAIDNPLPDFFLGRDVDFHRSRRIGFCGSWGRRKAPSFLIRDVTQFLRDRPEWTFSAVGIGSTSVAADFPEDIRSQIEEIPFLKREELAEWYHGLAIFTLPSIYESFGLVMAEAMACGAALAATKVGFGHDLDPGNEAMILPRPQSPHLYEAITKLAENDGFRCRVAQNGYERVQTLRWEDAVDRLESIYRSLVHHRHLSSEEKKSG